MLARLITYRLTTSTTLQVLQRNRTQLQSHPKLTPSLRTHTISNIAQQNKAQLIKYNSVLIQHLHCSNIELSNTFSQLDAFRNKLSPNAALVTGTEYSEYALPKIISICLHSLQQHKQTDSAENKQKQQQVWQALQSRAKQLYRNVSAVENILLLHISIAKFTEQMQVQVVKQIEEQVRTMTIMEKQLLYYTICLTQSNNNNNRVLPQISTRLHYLANALLQSIHKSKLTLAQLIQWTLLSAITNPNASLQSIQKPIQKIEAQHKHILSPQQMITLLRVLQSRHRVLPMQGEFTSNGIVRSLANRVIMLYYGRSSTASMLIQGTQQVARIRLATLMHYFHGYHPQHAILNSEQIVKQGLTVQQKVAYLCWLWNNQLMQHFQLKSVYESINISAVSNTLQSGFKDVDLVYHVCWLELGLDVFRNYQFLIETVHRMAYIPRDLQWVLWNYLAQLTKRNLQSPPSSSSSTDVTLSSLQKQQIQQIVHKIAASATTTTKLSFQKQEADRQQKDPQIREMVKFFHSIKAWSFKNCQYVGGLDYLSHFIDHDNKIVLHCLSEHDYVERSIANKQQSLNLQTKNQNSSKQQERMDADNKESITIPHPRSINQRHNLNTKLLFDNFGYTTINIDVGQFIKLNYNQRVQWLGSKIGQSRNIKGFISK